MVFRGLQFFLSFPVVLISHCGAFFANRLMSHWLFRTFLLLLAWTYIILLFGK
jgi:uncharacterized membrane protein YfcA